jgi:ABC-type dipeptide/oligopeptide/nickel transport system permease component
MSDLTQSEINSIKELIYNADKNTFVLAFSAILIALFLGLIIYSYLDSLKE